MIKSTPMNLDRCTSFQITDFIVKCILICLLLVFFANLHFINSNTRNYYAHARVDEN